MGERSKNALRVSASLLVAAVLLWFFFRRVSLSEVAQLLAAVKLGPAAAAVALALASYGARAWRWGLLLQGVGTPPFPTLAGCTAAGFATSTVLPARLGELVRPLLLSARAGLPPAATIASIVAERLLDLLTVVFLFAVALVTGKQGQEALVPSLLWTLGTVGVLGVGLVLLVKAREAIVLWLSGRAKGTWSRRLVHFVQELFAGLAFWGNPRHALTLGLASLVTWGLAVAQVAVTAQAFARTLSLREATLVLAVSVVGLAVPTPGGVGGFHAATQFALATIALWPLPPATAFALLHHIICFVPVSLVGFGYMLVVGFSWQQVSQGKPRG